MAGELDIATAPQLDRALRSAWASTSADVMRLDLRRLEFIDSTGVRLLLDADRCIRHAGGRLIIVRGPAEINWLLALMGADRLLELVGRPSSSADSPTRHAPTASRAPDGIAPVPA